MKTVQACVNPRLLKKADRLFTGTLDGRIIELLQNARRAGATKVEITNTPGPDDSTSIGRVTVRDNGRGVTDFAKLLDLGGSDWEQSLESSKDPAGVGLFCLAPRQVTIRSRKLRLTITPEGWTGAPLVVEPDLDIHRGTVLEFQDEAWDRAVVERHAVFSGLRVIVDGQRCLRLPFVSKEAAHHPELGCRIEVRPETEVTKWHRLHAQGRYCGATILINFHGQVVSLNHRPIDESDLRYLVDLTGEPTGIRLMLPARTRLVENDVYKQLLAAIEMEAYRYIQRRGNHTLPFKEFERAKELGIALPEAMPTCRVGLLWTDVGPEPVEVTLPKGLRLEQCYRLDPELSDRVDFADTNAHLLAALGKCETPFVPVDINHRFDGYSWAKLPTITKLGVEVGKEIHSDYLWSGQMKCVETLTIRAETSDGKRFSSTVNMAALPSNAEGPIFSEDRMAVTREAQNVLSPSEIWYHLGGWSEDGDTYESQEADFEGQLDRFWADVVGPDEHTRRKLLEATHRIPNGWQSITLNSSGVVTLQFADGAIKAMQPPVSTISTEQPTQTEE